MITNQSIVALLRLVENNNKELWGQVINRTTTQQDSVCLSNDNLQLLVAQVNEWNNQTVRPLLNAFDEIHDPINAHLNHSSHQRDNYFILSDQIEHLRELNNASVDEYTIYLLDDVNQISKLAKSMEAVNRLVRDHQARVLQQYKDQQRYEHLAADLRKYSILMAMSCLVTAANKLVADYIPALVSITAILPFAAYGLGVCDKIDQAIPQTVKTMTVATSEPGKKTAEGLYIARSIWNIYQIIPVARLLFLPLWTIRPRNMMNVMMAPIYAGQMISSSLYHLRQSATSGCLFTNCTAVQPAHSEVLQETTRAVSTCLANTYGENSCSTALLPTSLH